MTEAQVQLTGTRHYVERGFAILTALILLQTLYFKFSGASESIWIFSQMGIEPWGRYATGGVELIAGILLLFRRSAIFGAVLSIGTIAGAIFSHLFVLGIEVQGDGGFLFGLALGVFLLSAGVIAMRKDEVLDWVQRLIS